MSVFDGGVAWLVCSCRVPCCYSVVYVLVSYFYILSVFFFQDLYGVRSDLGNLFKALGRLEDAKVSLELE